MNMTIEQTIGQMIMAGWQTPDANDIVESIKTYNFGNVVLFTKNIVNIEQLRDLTGRIQEAAMEYNGAPALISLDQEGGSVRRIYHGVAPLSGNMAIAAATAKHPDAAYLAGKITGQELKALGVNFNLAPVVDINNNPHNPVIAIRSFGDNPMSVSELGGDYATGLQSEGVLACYKHFLGHGDVDVDSHLELPRVSKKIEDLELCELVPYKSHRRADAIMSVHILYSAIDDHFPISLSQKALKTLLRQRLNFDGLIITDCFEMDGLMRTFSLEEAAVFAVLATTDLITVSHIFGRQLLVRNSLINAAKNGVIPQEVLDASMKRISRIKEKYCVKSSATVPDYTKNKEIAQKLSAASIALISGKPFEIDNNTVVIGVSNYLNSVAEDANIEKMDIAKRIGEEFGLKWCCIDNKNFNVNETLSFVKDNKVILCLADSHLTLVQRVLYSSLIQARKKVILISMRTPYDILGQELPQAHYCTFEYTSMSCNALIDVLKGRKPVGVCPVKLNDRGLYAHPEGEENTVIITKIVEYLRLNFAKKISLESVASEFGLSSGYLCRLMKKKINKNFIDLLNEIRIGEAKRLLASSNLKIYEVASLTGYADIDYFSKLFKKFCGVTPTYYRNNYSIND